MEQMRQDLSREQQQKEQAVSQLQALQVSISDTALSVLFYLGASMTDDVRVCEGVRVKGEGKGQGKGRGALPDPSAGHVFPPLGVARGVGKGEG